MPDGPNTIGRGYQLPTYMDGRTFSFNELTSTQAAERLKRSPWTYACIRKYQDCLSSLDFIVQEWHDEEQEWVRVRNHPAEERFYDPNPYQSQQELLATNIGDFLRTGNSLTSILDFDSPKNRTGTPLKQCTARLEALHSDFAKPVLDSLDVLSGYYVARQGWSLVGYPVDGGNVATRNMVHARLPNPDMPIWGLSPLQVGLGVIDGEIASIEWNKALVQNSAKHSSVFLTDLALTEPQHKALTKIVRDSYSGANVGKPMVLSHGLKPHSLSQTPVEMDFIESGYLEAFKICALLNCPAPVIGISRDATLANLVEYFKQFWDTGTLPTVAYILNSYTRSWIWNRKEWGRRYRLWYDTGRVTALQTNLKEKVEIGERLVALGYTLNEVNNRLQLGMPEVEVGNVRHAPPGLVPIYDTSYQRRRSPEITTTEDDQDEARPGEGKSFEERERKAYWEQFERRRETHYERLELAAEDLVQKSLLQAANAVKTGEGDAGVDAVFEQSAKQWEDLLLTTWRNVGEEFYQATSDELQRRKNRTGGAYETKNFIGYWTSVVEDYVRRFVAEKVKSITRTDAEWIKSLVRLTLKESELSIDDAAKQIESLGPNYSKRRSFVIGRTEIIGTSSFAARQSAVQSGFVSTKEWISSRDERVRESHQDIDGEKRRLNEPYSNGMMFPGDPDGPAKETIQCRCVERYNVE